MSESLEEVVLVGGQTIYAHPRNTCVGYWCPIHYPSPHHMLYWDQIWRPDRGIMERICVHGVGHPDPDDAKQYDKYEAVHGCDGCCAREFDLEEDI